MQIVTYDLKKSRTISFKTASEITCNFHIPPTDSYICFKYYRTNCKTTE